MTEPLRLVLDTNVWLDLLWFRDPACAAVETMLEAGVAIALSRADCRTEWLRVLQYDTLRLGEAERVRLDAAHLALTTCIDDAVATRAAALPRCADPDDQKFLELARDGAATALLTRDRALLALARRCRRDHAFDIVTPVEFAARGSA